MAALADALVRADERIIAIAGAGGKTSLMFALAHELRERGERVITTTTTRIRVPERQQSENLVLRSDGGCRDRLEDGLAQTGHVTLAEQRLPGDKLQGIDCATLAAIFAASSADRLIVEADGARTLPLKAPGEGEPVVPIETDLFIAMIGLDALGLPLTEEHVFRPERVAALTGQAPGSIITVQTIARLAVHSGGLLKGCPETAHSALFLNKTDIPQGREKAEAIIKLVRSMAGNGPDAWLVGSVGQQRYTFFSPA